MGSGHRQILRLFADREVAPSARGRAGTAGRRVARFPARQRIADASLTGPLESSHAVAECIVRAPKLGKDQIIIVNLSGRGDKDVAQAADKIGLQMPK